MTTTTLTVRGMTCGHCVRAVQEALEGMAGVRSARVDLEAGRATVEYDEAKADPGAMVAVVGEEGYEAEEAG